MKPFKSGAILAAWLLRITLLWFVYVNYFGTFPGFDLKAFVFYVHTGYILFAVLLLAGGFMQKPGLTVLSGLAIFILPVAQLIREFPDEPAEVLLLYLLPLSIGFYFFTGGNNS
jgi:hypothetical protein